MIEMIIVGTIGVTQEELKNIFHYEDGKLFWKRVKSKARQVRAGDRAGTLDYNGYRRVKICNKAYKEHRLIFMYHHGYLPEFIDHINGKKDDNRIENLRPATRSQNAFNSKVFKNNQSGITGVSETLSGKWRARIRVEGKYKHLGVFDTVEEAVACRRNAEITVFQGFSKGGKNG